jgi:tripartite ATP-independent transporter DctM subunit
MAVTAALCLWRPSLGGPRRHASWGERLRGLRHLGPVLLLFGAIVGSIYAGIATPTEAAAVGVAAALGIAGANGALGWSMMRASLLGAVRVTAMIMLVVIGATFLNFTLSAAGLGRQLQALMGDLQLTPFGVLMAVIVLYIVLGFFIETLSLMVATIPIVTPLIVAAGYDKVWFGILLIVLVEMALITPPVGLNLYVVQGARAKGRLGEVMVGAAPYVVAMGLMIVLLILAPGLALWLPQGL